tara:strand:+ start:349 stop:678 length:330 start_codon:yes stop_codon:yes gene_type:complete
MSNQRDRDFNLYVNAVDHDRPGDIAGALRSSPVIASTMTSSHLLSGYAMFVNKDLSEHARTLYELVRSSEREDKSYVLGCMDAARELRENGGDDDDFEAGGEEQDMPWR